MACWTATKWRTGNRISVWSRICLGMRVGFLTLPYVGSLSLGDFNQLQLNPKKWCKTTAGLQQEQCFVSSMSLAGIKGSFTSKRASDIVWVLQWHIQEVKVQGRRVLSQRTTPPALAFQWNEKSCIIKILSAGSFLKARGEIDMIQSPMALYTLVCLFKFCAISYLCHWIDWVKMKICSIQMGKQQLIHASSSIICWKYK